MGIFVTSANGEETNNLLGLNSIQSKILLLQKQSRNRQKFVTITGLEPVMETNKRLTLSTTFVAGSLSAAN